MGKYFAATYSFGSTGEKTLVVDLDGETPTWVRITMGARLNTTETGAVQSYGVSDGVADYCRAIWPGGSKAWPYSSEAQYIGVAYSSAGVKKVSAKRSVANPLFDADEINLYVDVADANYQMLVECGN